MNEIYQRAPMHGSYDKYCAETSINGGNTNLVQA